MTSKKFKIFFTDSENNKIDVDYVLDDNVVAQKWFAKIKHLHKIPINRSESNMTEENDLANAYFEFCKYAGIDTEQFDFENSTQAERNQLHDLYEFHHDRLTGTDGNDALYRFHKAIHRKDINIFERVSGHYISWGIKEGPLTEKFLCNPFYAPEIKKNHIYAPESELGKTPHQFWEHNELGDQQRFNRVSKPHITLRARFHIAEADQQPKEFSQEFIDWFEQFKTGWFEAHNITEWRPIDEQTGVLVGHTDCKLDLHNMHFYSIKPQ